MSQKNIPKDVLEAIEYEVGRAGLEYADNYRAYRRKDGYMRDEFIAARKNGCCGFYEVSIIDVAGDHWIVGCNHGH